MTENLLQGDDLPHVDPDKNYFQELVGDGKKFKTPEDLAKGKFEADQYIKILERTRDEMRDDYLKLREDYQSRAKLEELIDQMKNQQQSSSDTTHTANDDKKPVFDPKEIESLVSSKIQEHESTRRQAENYNLIKSKLQERYGESYKEVLKTQIEALDITENELNDMARQKPKFLMKTLGLDTPVSKESFQSPISSNQRTDNFSPSASKKRTWSYYQNLKRDNPKLYQDPKTQVQMQKDYIELGDAFEDGNFRS
jgi:hypothetical protein